MILQTMNAEPIDGEVIQPPLTARDRRILRAAKRGDMRAQLKVASWFDSFDALDWDDEGHYSKIVVYYFDDPGETRLMGHPELADETHIDVREIPVSDLVKDGRTAFIWYHRSAKQGCRRAMERVASFYGFGYGVKKNLILARRWWRKAARLGSKLARDILLRKWAERVK